MPVDVVVSAVGVLGSFSHVGSCFVRMCCCVWGVAGWNIWPEKFLHSFGGVGGSACCWVLRRHRPVGWGVLGAVSGLDRLTHSLCPGLLWVGLGVVVVVVGWGVVVC